MSSPAYGVTATRRSPLTASTRSARGCTATAAPASAGSRPTGSCSSSPSLSAYAQLRQRRRET